MFRKLILTLFFAAGVLSAENTEFEKTVNLKIFRTTGSIFAPDRFTDNWRSAVCSYFGRDFYTFRVKKWTYECQAQDEIDYQTKHLTGNAHILYNKNFYSDFPFKLKLENGYYENVRLCLKNNLFVNHPSILFLHEEVIIIEGWFTNEYKYKYLLELSDGSIWSTSERKSQWKFPWKTGSPILYLGNQENPVLINLDTVSTNNSFVDKKDCLNYYFNKITCEYFPD